MRHRIREREDADREWERPRLHDHQAKPWMLRTIFLLVAAGALLWIASAYHP